jgi:hypothetical protein
MAATGAGRRWIFLSEKEQLGEHGRPQREDMAAESVPVNRSFGLSAVLLGGK